MSKNNDMTASALLESVTHAGVQNPSEMAWDADGNRVSFTSSSTSATTEFVYDVTAGIPAVIEETGQVYYVREPNGSLIARVDGSNASYYHFDALGSTRLVTDSAGVVTDEYTYDAWGSLTDHTQHDGSVDQPYQYVGQLGYYTHVQDANLPLLQLGVRMYDPEIGRFTQEDPIDPLHRLNLIQYRYVRDSVTMLVDPWGLTPMLPKVDACGCYNFEAYINDLFDAAGAQWCTDWSEHGDDYLKCVGKCALKSFVGVSTAGDLIKLVQPGIRFPQGRPTASLDYAKKCLKGICWPASNGTPGPKLWRAAGKAAGKATFWIGVITTVWDGIQFDLCVKNECNKQYPDIADWFIPK